MPNVPSRPLTPSPPFRRGGGAEITFDSENITEVRFVTLRYNGGMLCHSPASLAEGGGGKGAGGGLGIQPHYNFHKPKVIYTSLPPADKNASI